MSTITKTVNGTFRLDLSDGRTDSAWKNLDETIAKALRYVCEDSDGGKAINARIVNIDFRGITPDEIKACGQFFRIEGSGEIMTDRMLAIVNFRPWDIAAA